MPRFQAIDQNGRPMVGSTLYTYQNKTTTPHPTWKDREQTAYNTNPIVLDARGEAVVWLDPEQVYTFVLRDWFGALVWSQDDVAGGASQIDLAAPDGSSMVGFIQAGAGAVARTSRDKMREVVSVKDFGAVGDGVTDDTAAIQAAADAAKIWKVALHIPAGEFSHSGILTFDSISVYGGGTLRSTDTTTPDPQHAVVLTGNSPSIENIIIKADWGGVRQANANSAGIFINNATNFKVAGCSVADSASAGIFITQSTGGIVLNNLVTDTLADGIHVTGASTEVLIQGNKTASTGDDCIAAVSYVSNGSPVSYIKIVNNTCIDGLARGITVVGGEDILIQGNFVDNSAQAAYYLASESSYNTFAPKRVVVSNNIGQNCTTGTIATGIFISSSNPGYTAKDILVSGNIFRNVKTSSIIRAAEQVIFSGNIFDGISGGNGADVQEGAKDISIIGNSFKNIFVYGVAITSASGIVRVCDNDFKQVNIAGISYVDCILVPGAVTADRVYIQNNTHANVAPYTVLERFIECNVAGAIITGNYSATHPYVVGIHNAQRFESGTNYRVSYYTSAPSTGTWAVGDIVYHSTPVAAGNIGWVCVAAGTPGTWKAFGKIDP